MVIRTGLPMPDLLAVLREFAAEDSQCRPDWLDLKAKARDVIAAAEGRA